jgi:hypothetical protein
MMARAQNLPGRTRPPDTIFVPAPVVAGPANRPAVVAPHSQEFPPAQSKTDTFKTDGATPQGDPNIWVPRKLKQEQNNHPMGQAQGTSRRSLMQPQLWAQGRPFFLTLHEWATEGVPVDCGPDLEWDVIEQAVACGPHRSAMEPNNIKLVHEDIQYQVDAGFSWIMFWSDLKELRPRNLKISPMAVVPQKDRCGRLILDLSFPVYPERTKTN